MTLPHLRQYLELGALLGSIYIVQNFDAVFTITSGGLGTANLPYTDLPDASTTAHDYGRASAAGVVVVIGVDHHRDVRAARRVVAVPRGGVPMSTATQRRPNGPADAGARAPRRATGVVALAGLGHRPALLLPVALDGADLAATARPTPRPTRRSSARAADPRRLPGLLRRVDGTSPWPPLINSLTASVVSTHPGAAAGHPGGVRAVDPAGAQVDRRDVLLPLDEDAAGGGRPAADLPDRHRSWACWTTSGCWSSSTPR